MSVPAKRPSPKPWSMKWIALAIVLFVVGYTLVNIYYRKPGRAFRPYEDMNNRATTARLLAAGWQKLPVELRLPAEKPALTLAATVNRGEGGLGAELEAAFAAKPVLLATIGRVTAPQSVARGATCAIYFSGTLTDQHLQLAHVDALRRGDEIVLVPSLEKLPGKDLLTRWNDGDYWAGLDTERLEPGRYRVRLAARGPAAEWTFTVTP